MRLRWQVQSCELAGSTIKVSCVSNSKSHRDYWDSGYGKLIFYVEPEQAKDWWAGRVFETEVPYIDSPSTPVITDPHMVIVPDDEEVYEEVGNGRGLFGRRR